jgi:excisionase family DNA binding protein
MDTARGTDPGEEEAITASDLTTKQVAERLGVTPSHVARLIRDAELEGRKVGTTWMVTREALACFTRRPVGRPRHTNPHPYLLKRRERYWLAKQQSTAGNVTTDASEQSLGGAQPVDEVCIPDVQYIPPRTAAKILGVSRSRICQLIQDGRLDGIRRGGRVFIPYSQIDRLRERKTARRKRCRTAREGH